MPEPMPPLLSTSVPPPMPYQSLPLPPPGLVQMWKRDQLNPPTYQPVRPPPTLSEILVAQGPTRMYVPNNNGWSGYPSERPILQPTPLNGGDSAWGGTTAWLPSHNSPQFGGDQETLGLGLSSIYKGIKLVWRYGAWTAKIGEHFLGPVGTVLDAYQLYEWAKVAWTATGGVGEPPATVPTQYQFSGLTTGMVYQWPGGSWSSAPPPGYDQAGRRMGSPTTA